MPSVTNCGSSLKQKSATQPRGFVTVKGIENLLPIPPLKGTSPMNTPTGLAFLLLRLLVGLTISTHGAQKLFGAFGGPGFKNALLFFDKQGFSPAWFWLSLACLGEFGGGLSLAAGFLTPLGAAGVFGAMLMATFKTNWVNGFFIQKGGFEYTLLILMVSIFFGLAGPGGYSLDALLGVNLPLLVFLGSALIAIVVVSVGILVSNSKPAAKTK